MMLARSDIARTWGDNGIVVVELILLACSFIARCAFIPFVDVLRIISSYIEVFRNSLLPLICDGNCYYRDSLRWVVVVIVDVLGCVA